MFSHSQYLVWQPVFLLQIGSWLLIYDQGYESRPSHISPSWWIPPRSLSWHSKGTIHKHRWHSRIRLWTKVLGIFWMFSHQYWNWTPIESVLVDTWPTTLFGLLLLPCWLHSPWASWKIRMEMRLMLLVNLPTVSLGGLSIFISFLISHNLSRHPKPFQCSITTRDLYAEKLAFAMSSTWSKGL